MCVIQLSYRGSVIKNTIYFNLIWSNEEALRLELAPNKYSLFGQVIAANIFRNGNNVFVAVIFYDASPSYNQVSIFE